MLIKELSEARRLSLSGGQVREWRCALVPARHRFTKRFPEIARACEKLAPDTLIDGEVIAIDDTPHEDKLKKDPAGRVSFKALQHRPTARLIGGLRGTLVLL
jgi:hypothetical protein